ncbi:MAG: hypothetical protein J7K04_07165 [Spirochaetales bacterium]|nr:hypothetical protein [Spirochaetales bacterium]
MKTYKSCLKALIFLSILLAPLSTAIADNFIFLSVRPGSYNTNKRLNIVPLKKDIDISYSFVNIKTGNKNADISSVETHVPYMEPLYLTALKGEERHYGIVVQVSEKNKLLEKRLLIYTIDKREPIGAKTSEKSGVYYRPVLIAFKNNRKDSVYYSLNGDIYTNPHKWNGKPLVLVAEKGKEKKYVLDCYTEDSAGNRSSVKSYAYIINHKEPYLNILSPVDGDFANYQFLYIISKNVQWVKYTLDGSDPVKNGIVYNGPSLLKYSGNINLHIAAKPQWSANVNYIRRSIFLKIRPEKELSITNDYPSGLYKRGIKIDIRRNENEKIFYTLSEKTPKSYDFLFKKKLYLRSVPSAQKLYTLRIRGLKNSGQWGKEYRYFYILDRRNISEAKTESKVQKKAESGLPPSPPVVNAGYSKENRGTYIVNVKSLKGIKILYEISSSGTPRDIKPGVSPVVESPLEISVPYGMQGDFLINFAAITSAGIISAQKLLRFSIDKKPPSKPLLFPAPDGSVYDKSIKVTVEKKEGTVFYTMTDDGTEPDDPTENSAKISRELALNGEKGKLTEYRIKMLCRDDNGNISKIFGPYSYIIDMRIPVIPRIKGFENSEKYNSASVTINIPSGYPNMHYTISENGKTPKDPNLKSPLLKGDSLKIEGPPGRETHYTVKILPASVNGHIIGPIKTLKFTIDRKPPAVPELAGVKEGSFYRRQVSISAKRTEKNESLFISYSTSEVPPPDPLKYGEKLTGKLIFDVKNGEAKTFKLRLTAVDGAGNRSIYDRFFSFTIDKKPPDNLSIEGIPPNGVSSDAVVISMHASDGTIFYSVSDDGSLPSIPDSKSKKYDAPFILSGIPGREITYRIIARAVDKIGNFTTDIHVYSVTVDRKPPDSAPEPILKKHGNIKIVMWNVPEGYSLYYRFNSGFALYTKPLSLRKTSRIHYYLMDRAGNKSPEKVKLIDIPFYKISAPVIKGAENGGHYNHPVKISFLANTGIVRYEISVDGTEPPPVTDESPIANNSVSVDVIDGDTISVKITARGFDDSGNYSELSSLEFVLDKTPPSAPIITGIENNGHYQDSKKIKLLADEGRIYYALSSNGLDPEIPEQNINSLYKKEIVLPAEDGKIKDYRLLAYTVDSAGNRSRDIPIWHVIIDRKIIYVSNSGNDLYPGTASRPFRSLKKAVDTARKEGRKVIYIAAGVYNFERTLKINSMRLSIYGGYNPGNWRKSAFQKTEITSGKYLRNSDPLVDISGGRLYVSNCSFYNKIKNTGPLIMLGGGELVIKDSFVKAAGRKDVSGIEQTGGKLTISNCEFSAESAEKVNLITSAGGFLYIEGSNFEGSENLKNFTAIKIKNNVEVILRGVHIKPGSGENIIGINAENTNFIFSSGSISSGLGSKRSIAMLLKNTDAAISRAKINMEKNSPYPVAVFAESSRITVDKTTFKIAGAYGATGLQIKNCDIIFTKNMIEAGFSQEYLYPVILTGSGYFSNNIIYKGTSGDYIAVQLFNSSSHWFNNTIVGGKGRDLTEGFYIDGKSRPEIVNNIISREGAIRGDGIFIAGKDRVDFPIITNDIAGWENMLKFINVGSGKSGIYKYQRSAQFRSVKNSESMNNFDGNPFGGFLNGNIKENIKKTFILSKGINFHLSRSSACVNSGTGAEQLPELHLRFKVPNTDFENQIRPAPLIGIKPAYDIGADEVY